MRRFAYAVLVILAVSPAGAADRPLDNPEAMLREDVVVHRVRWPVLVQPKDPEVDKALCAGLAPEDFDVRENGSPVRVTSVDPLRGETRYVLLIDSSRSMDAVLDTVKRFAKAFAVELVPQHEVWVYSFGRGLELRRAASRDAAAVRAAIDGIEGGEMYTALHDSIYALLDEFDHRGGRTAILVITDGDEGGSLYYSERELVERATASRDVRVFPILTVSHQSLSSAPMWAVANATGGVCSLAPNAGDIDFELHRARSRLESEMTVTYAPPPRAAAAKQARLRVKVRPRRDVPCRITEAMPERFISSAPRDQANGRRP